MQLVSIIIPIFNVEEYLNRCIQSIIRQTYNSIEVILVDDGSTDKSGEICDGFSRSQNVCVKVIHQDNQGVSEARKNGLKQAKGKYIAFVDADDWIEKDYVEKLVDALESTNADMSCCGFYEEYVGKSVITSNNKEEMQLYSGSEAVKMINVRKDIHSVLWNKLYVKEFLNELQDSVPVIIGEDYTVLMHCVSKMSKVVSISKPLYHYIQRESSVCNRGFDERMFAVVDNYNKVCLELGSKDETIYSDIKNYMLVEEMYYIICMNKNNKYNHKFIKMVKKDLKDNIGKYIGSKDIAFSMKCCAISLAINYHLLIGIYSIVKRKKVYYK